jgi:hypothetical protein
VEFALASLASLRAWEARQLGWCGSSIVLYLSEDAIHLARVRAPDDC